MTACALRFSLFLCALLAAVRAEETGVRTTREAAATTVIFNTRDPESRGLAEYYAERRGIPADNIIGLDCPLEEEISRKDYIETIEKPLRALFERKGWWGMRTGLGDKQEIDGSHIRFMALMRGIPLKIKTTIQPPTPEATPPPRPCRSPRSQPGRCCSTVWRSRVAAGRTAPCSSSAVRAACLPSPSSLRVC